MAALKILAVCGSLRKGSFNRKLLETAKAIAMAAGADVSEYDLKNPGLPLYDGDIEAAGLPPAVIEFKKQVAAADVLLIASPEYNYSISGTLKNAIDWLSRGEKNSLGGKFAAIFGASAGPLGTVRGQNQLRQILTCVDVTVLPQPQVLVGLADGAFDPDGSLKDAKKTAALKQLIEKTLKTAEKCRS